MDWTMIITSLASSVVAIVSIIASYKSQQKTQQIMNDNSAELEHIRNKYATVMNLHGKQVELFEGIVDAYVKWTRSPFDDFSDNNNYVPQMRYLAICLTALSLPDTDIRTRAKALVDYVNDADTAWVDKAQLHFTNLSSLVDGIGEALYTYTEE